MGLADRDYNRRPARQPGSRHPVFRHPAFFAMRSWTITTWIIAINITVFVVDAITGGPGAGLLTRLGYFSWNTAISHLQLWRFITFQFLHVSPMHLFFNMLMLFYFGAMVERFLGRARYLAFYLICGMGGAAAYLLLVALHLPVVSITVPMVGASAGIFGVLVAAAVRVAPTASVMLLFPPIPMKLRNLAWIMLGIAAFTLFIYGHNAAGEAAHLGGAGVGYLLIQRPQVLNVFTRWPRRKPKRSGWKMSDWR